MYRIIICKIILMCTIVGTTINDFEGDEYDDYKVFEVIPTTKELLNALNDLKTVEGFYFFQPKTLTSLNKRVIVIVNPEKLHIYYDLMDKSNATFRVLHDNAKELVQKAKYENTINSFDFSKYHTLDEIYDELDRLASQYPKTVETVVGGRTYENRDIKGVKISFKANNPGVFIEGGIHSRNWMSPAAIMYVLHQLLTSKDKDVRELAERHDWYIFPLFNPDGYEYSHSKPFRRFWSKSRKPYNSSCVGANLNMNWDYKWDIASNNKYPCSVSYPGIAPFSEIETKSMSEYIKTISNKFYAYISINNNEPFILFPYGYTMTRVDNYNELMAIGNKVKEVLKRKNKINFFVGSIADKFDMISGNTVDYIRGIYGTRLVYMYPLYHIRGYKIPPEDIIPMGKQTLDSFVAMFKEAKVQENKRKP